MEIAALVAWVATAAGGFAMLAIWVAKGGIRQQGEGRTRFPAPVVFAHMLVAAAGLVVWLLYVASDDTDALAWLAVALLVVVGALGATLFVRWLSVRGAAPPPDGDEAAERHIPVAAAAGHGVLAITTVVLVVLAAAGIGT